MSNLLNHAKFELERAGLFDKDSDYGGAVAEGVMRLMELFSQEGHSGASAMMTLEIFKKLASFKPLTPLTNDPAEWMEVGEDMIADKTLPLHQNRRQSSCFSNDGGHTYYDINANDGRRLRRAEPFYSKAKS